MQLIGTKHYPVQAFSEGMDDFVIDEKTLKTTPGLRSGTYTSGLNKSVPIYAEKQESIYC